MDLSRLDLAPGAITQVVGPSGSGLSTLADTLRRKVPGTAVVIRDAAAHVTFLRETVTEEVAFGLEQRGVAPERMRRRVAETLNALGLVELSEAHPEHLSGGQLRRLAVATVAVLDPAVLVLDDSFAGLDVASVRALTDLCRSRAHGATVVLGYRTQPGLGGQVLGLDEGVLHANPPSPWEPALPDPVPLPGGRPWELGEITARRGTRRRRWWWPRRTAPGFMLGPVNVTVTPGQVLWLRGGNGAGKTTLLRALAGLDGHPGAPVPASLLLQRAEDQVVEHTVADFIGTESAARRLDCEPGVHPLDLSATRLRLAQAAAVFGQGRPLVLVDEPDVGLDDAGRSVFHRLLAEVLADGRAVIMTCHDHGMLAEVGRYAEVAILDLTPPSD